MIRSMTSFAGLEDEIEGTVYGWEIRTVNHRYLDINLRIPENLRTLESFFRTVISQRVKRGKVDCTLYWHQLAENRRDFFLDRERLAGLIRVMGEIESEVHRARPCTALEILAWPGILTEQKVDAEKLKFRIGKLLENAMSRLIECREREGARLAGMILERCQELAEQVRLVRARLPVLAEKLRNKLQAKLEEISVEVDPNRFEQEIVFLLQKMDVDEEMERLETHIAEVERILEHEDVAGRRLDFLFQEMNREANTLGSKSIDQTTTQASVEMKVLIEQMREQVQNIE